MAPRSIWSGTISFGLVSIPVRILTATSSRELRFHFGYDKVRKDTGEHVDADDVELTHFVGICDRAHAEAVS